MRVAFVGPSAPDAGRMPAAQGIDVRGPAAQGDLAEAVLQGANVIGLVDGTFESSAAVWHKEILFALAQGVQVFGAASIGALRAAECTSFGMIGVGQIFHDYASGNLIDDDAVAVIHAPGDLMHETLSEPLVNVMATCRALRAKGLITGKEEAAVVEAARGLFFKERTHDRILDRARLLPRSRSERIGQLLAMNRHDQKREDATALLQRVAVAEDSRVDHPAGWQFNETVAWRHLLKEVERRVVAEAQLGRKR